MCPNYQSHNYYTNDKIQINKITSSEIKLKLRLRTATLKMNAQSNSKIIWNKSNQSRCKIEKIITRCPNRI